MIMEEKSKANDAHHKPKNILPNVDEIQKFREIQFLHHSNLFRMQIEEMMTTLEIKKKSKVKINSWFNDLSKLLRELPQSKQFQLSNLKWVKENGIDVPLNEFSKLPNLNGIFTFVPPADVSMVGSYPLDLSSTHSKIIDVALVLPKEFFQSNDLFNGKWIFRRALYLSWLGKLLQTKTELISSVCWVHHTGSRLRPVLQVVPSEKVGKWKFNLFPIPHDDCFKINIISPTKSNILPSWFFQKDNIEDEIVGPSPYHNWVCSVDLLALKHFKFLEENLKHSNFIQGLKLLKVWLKQRNLIEGETCVSSHLLAMFVVYLIKARKLSTQMSSYQVFRTVLLQLSQTDWSKEGPSLIENPDLHDRNIVLPGAEDFHRLYPVVFIDTTGFFNIAGNVSLEVYSQLRHEAKIGIDILEFSSTNSFDALFISKTEFQLTFDQTIQISLTSDNVDKIFESTKLSKNILMDRLGDTRPVVFSYIISVLSQGLGNRVEYVGFLRENEDGWPYGSPTPDFNRKLTLGFLINPRASVNLLTKGPSADSPDALSFREFWGELSTLRRFRDSTFHEAVLWGENDPIGDRRLILGKIVSHLLKMHFDVPQDRIHYVAKQLEDTLRMRYTFKDENFKYGTGEESISSAILSFDALAKKLRSLDLPLKVTGVQSVSDVLKHTVVFPPLPIYVPRPYIQKSFKRFKVNHEEISDEMNNSKRFKEISDEMYNCPLYRESISVQIFLEISGKWPDDLVAIKSVKEEFLRKMSELLEEEGITCVIHPSSLQVIWEGFSFSIKVCYRREIYLLRAPLDDGDASDLQRDTDASIRLEKEMEILPRLTSSLNSLQSEFPCFGGSARLIKRWVSSQLLLPHFSSIVIDLIVAYLYLNPHPYKAPNTPHVALLRFMNFMAKTEWRSTPIFVNLRSQFQANDESELTKRFTNDRSSFPPMFICSPCELRPLASAHTETTTHDLNKRLRLASCWSRPEPSLLILGRMKVLAKAALTAYHESLWLKSFDFRVLFRPQLRDYDALIYLNERNLARRMEGIDKNEYSTMIPYSHVKGELVPITDFDPAQLYLAELRNAFGNESLFFHDELGGSVIGVLWKPHVSTEKETKKCNFEKGKIFGTNDMKIVTDVDSIVEGFRILGDGLVKKIKLKDYYYFFYHYETIFVCAANVGYAIKFVCFQDFIEFTCIRVNIRDNNVKKMSAIGSYKFVFVCKLVICMGLILSELWSIY